MPLCETVISAIHMLSSDGGYVRDDREDVASHLRNSNYFDGIRGTGIPRRVMSLHDALAQVLVSDEKHEVIAVGSSLAEEHLTLYVARNGKDGPDISATKERLESVWTHLKAIRSSVPPSFRMSPDPVGIGDDVHLRMHERFRYAVYESDRLKLIKRFGKMDKSGFKAFFEQVLSPNSKFVCSREAALRQGMHAFIYEDEDELVASLAGVYRLILRYLESRAEDDLRKIVHAMIMAVDAFKERSAKLREDIFARRDGDFFTRCNLILNQTRPEGPRSQKPDAFRRFWQKAFSLEHAVEDLLRLPYSSRLGHLLDRDFEVVAAPAQRNVLKFNLKEDSEFHKLFQTPEDCEDFLERKKPSLRCDSEVSTHCECTLLAYFVRQNISALGYIGISKLSCAPCSWYFAAYNSVASFGKTFHTCGSYGKRYPGWTYARISWDIDNAIEVFLLRKAHDELLSTLRRQRCDLDSTDTSSPSVRFVDGPLQQKHFAHDRKTMMLSAYEDGDLQLPRD